MRFESEVLIVRKRPMIQPGLITKIELAICTAWERKSNHPGLCLIPVATAPGSVTLVPLLLHSHIARGPNAQVLTRVQMYVLAAFAEHARGPDSGANGRAHRGAHTTTGNGADDRADAHCCADFFHVISSGTFSLHATFLVDLAYTLAASGNDFDYLRTHL